MRNLTSTTRRVGLAGLLLAGLLLAACAGSVRQAVVPPSAVAALAPTGTLRIAVYPGSPTSLVQAAPPEAMRGVAVELGRALARRMAIAHEVKVYARLAEALAALQRGEADFTITNATAERQRVLDFAPTLVDLELGVLVPPGGRLTATESMDQAGVTIGVSQGSTSERVLGNRLKLAKLRPYPTLDAARAALLAGEIDGFATNKGILFEQAERAPGTRVLDGRWGTEHLAPAVPKGRSAGTAYLQVFTQEVRASGEFAEAARRAGLRGFVPPAP